MYSLIISHTHTRNFFINVTPSLSFLPSPSPSHRPTNSFLSSTVHEVCVCVHARVHMYMSMCSIYTYVRLSPFNWACLHGGGFGEIDQRQSTVVTQLRNVTPTHKPLTPSDLFGSLSSTLW